MLSEMSLDQENQVSFCTNISLHNSTREQLQKVKLGSIIISDAMSGEGERKHSLPNQLRKKRRPYS
jgi:hypothetical protein